MLKTYEKLLEEVEADYTDEINERKKELLARVYRKVNEAKDSLEEWEGILSKVLNEDPSLEELRIIAADNGDVLNADMFRLNFGS